MNRSRKKTPTVGHTTCRSEHQDKKIWHKSRHACERTALTSTKFDDLDAYFPLVRKAS